MMRARIGHSAALGRWFHDTNLWFVEEDLAGGGALFDLGCHTVDVMRWFMGQPKSVVAKIQNFSGAYDIDDNSVVTVEFESGALGCSTRRGSIARVRIRSRSTAPRASSALTLGWCDAALDHVKPRASRASSSHVGLLSPAVADGAVDQRDPPRHGDDDPVEDGRNLTEMLERAYQAARTGKEVGSGPSSALAASMGTLAGAPPRQDEPCPLQDAALAGLAHRVGAPRDRISSTVSVLCFLGRAPIRFSDS